MMFGSQSMGSMSPRSLLRPQQMPPAQMPPRQFSRQFPMFGNLNPMMQNYFYGLMTQPQPERESSHIAPPAISGFAPQWTPQQAPQPPSIKPNGRQNIASILAGMR